MVKSTRRHWLQVAGAWAGMMGWRPGLARGEERREVDPMDEAVTRGTEFLRGLFDETMALLPEFAGSRTYWLYHDNYLAAHVLGGVDPEKAKRIRRRTRDLGVTKSGKIEIVTGAAAASPPFFIPELVDVKRIGEKLIRTERLTDRVFDGWREYADLVCLSLISNPTGPSAPADYERLISFWDGHGFADRVTRETGIYATYKLALAMLARDRQAELPMQAAITQRLASLQSEAGGWYTDYNADGKPVGECNVETTCLVLMAISSRSTR